MVKHDETEHLYALFYKILRKLRALPTVKSSTSTTRVQLLVLKTIFEQKQCTAGYLAKAIGVRPATMSQMLARLEKAGFITRYKDLADARVRIIRLTGAARDLFQELEDPFIQKPTGLLAYLTPREQQTFIHLLEKLAEQFAGPYNDQD